MVPPFTTTNTFRSIPVIIALLMLPLFIAAVMSFYILTVIEGTGLATGFAVGYLDTLKNTVAVMDQVILFVFGTSIAAVIIRSFQLKTHPALGIVGLFFIPVVVIGVAFTSNLFGIFTGLEMMQTAANNFSLSIAFFNNSALIAAATSVLVLMIMIGGGLRARR